MALPFVGMLIGGFGRGAISAALRNVLRGLVRSELVRGDSSVQNFRIIARDNLEVVLRDLDDISRLHGPFIAAKTLTALGRDVKVDLADKVTDVFQGVSPFVKNGVFSTVAPATASPSVWAGMRDVNKGRASPADYVKEHFSGGPRGHKPMERAMMALGALPSGWRAIPGSGMKLDKLGNPTRRQVAEVIGALKSGMSVLSGRGSRQKQIRYFVKSPGSTDKLTAHLAPGIWRSAKAANGSQTIQPVFFFVDSADYRKVIDLRSLANRTIERRLPLHLHQAVEEAKRKFPARSGR